MVWLHMINVFFFFFSQELLVDLGWASKKREKGEEADGGSTQTDGSSGDDCDDEDGCEASGEESGESHVHTNTKTHVGREA